MKVHEQCTCGAQIDVEDRWRSDVIALIAPFRKRHATCKPTPDDEPQPSGDTYTATERAGEHRGPSIGFEPNLPGGYE